MYFQIHKHILEFVKPARTSRGDYVSKPSWLITLHDADKEGKGEVSPLPDLSMDANADFELEILNINNDLSNGVLLKEIINSLDYLPALKLGIECALLDLELNNNGIIFNTPFTQKTSSIPINGLVWMADTEAMMEEAIQKYESGFRCIKFKIGALDHDTECVLIEKIRKKYAGSKLEIRLDANGAFLPGDSLAQIKDFSRFDIHSIEQPIKAGNPEHMGEICAKSTIKIALDEELIGVQKNNIAALFKTTKPHYIILKPTLLGGFSNCDTWIKYAELNQVGWWATSALEGNIGLSNIAQWVATKNNKMHQGLGTGMLFKNNFPAELEIIGEQLWFVN